MLTSWKSFALGALSMLIIIAGGYLVFLETDQRAVPPETNPTETADQSNTVTITPLPSLRVLYGIEVPFKGKVELKQTIAGRAARNITVVSFQATGEHAEKSVIKIVWENGEIEHISPGTQDKQFSPERRAVEIVVLGYSMRERAIFKDSARNGTLTWEIRYEPVD
ncbi:MAG: hypothetical protein ACRDBM_12680 [Sporomusa sp.]